MIYKYTCMESICKHTGRFKPNKFDIKKMTQIYWQEIKLEHIVKNKTNTFFNGTSENNETHYS